MALPKEAAFEIEGNYFALVLTDKKEGVYTFNRVKLVIGKQSEAYIEVLNSPDFKGKEVLSKGVFMLMTE